MLIGPLMSSSWIAWSLSMGAYCTSLVYWSLIVQSLPNYFMGFVRNEGALSAEGKEFREAHWLVELSAMFYFKLCWMTSYGPMFMCLCVRVTCAMDPIFVIGNQEIGYRSVLPVISLGKVRIQSRKYWSGLKHKKVAFIGEDKMVSKWLLIHFVLLDTGCPFVFCWISGTFQ